MTISDIMTVRLVTIGMDETLKVVKEIFKSVEFHHLLVVEEETLVGVVSDRDLLRALSPYLGTAAETNRDIWTQDRKVHQIMSRHLITLSENAEVRDAIAIFNTEKISCIPIIDDQHRAVGIVSWRDILRSMI